MNMDEKEIPALGRPFDLGMLYDCRTHNLLTDRRIWDEKNIKLHTVSHPQPQCDFDFTADDTISAKTAFLDINADLKLSLLCGWVQVHGSAKYLENHRKYTRQSRVTFKYRCRTHFKELLIREIMSERQINPRILSSENATHVVAGILYGTDAILVFDRTTTDEEDELETQRKLEAMVKFLPTASIKSNTDERKNKLLDNIEFTYHGDIPLDSEPSSFEENIKAFKTFPSKIGHIGENCVPMNVFLYPLCKITNKTLTLTKPLEVTLVNQIGERLEKVQFLKMKCNDLYARPTCEYDERYRQKVREMQTSIEQSEQKFKSQLSQNVTGLISMDLIKRNVWNFLEEYDKSPFSHEKLDNNLSELRTVINVLDTCVRTIPSSIKDTHSNPLKDIKHQFSHVDGQFQLPPIEHFFEELRKDDSLTTAQRKQGLMNNIFSMRKRIKDDRGIFKRKH
ncbi:neoverrucotoxin subunit beta-like [Mytilus californianus]|uniref:neoverrucotoxin subunit beta-like n=1 Tax=Mytilus californianus TaxID=6549 RepID=UPI0022477B82|nr:neoverrucotoxin subunit beta-like [Mytilus californianus]